MRDALCRQIQSYLSIRILHAEESINSNLHKIDRTRVTHEDKKYISDMERRIKEGKTGPSRDETTVLDCLKVYDNYHAFEASRAMSLENSSRLII